jgi:hypothetical protein
MLTNFSNQISVNVRPDMMNDPLSDTIAVNNPVYRLDRNDMAGLP